MGFFSWNCHECGRSIVNAYARCPVTRWQGEFILFTKQGDVASGREYEGYGFGDYSDGYYNDFTIYHKACWEHAGKPEYRGPSVYAQDQGYFFSDGDHDAAPPGTENPEEWLRLKKIERNKTRHIQLLREAEDDLDDMHYEVFGYSGEA